MKCLFRPLLDIINSLVTTTFMIIISVFTLIPETIILTVLRGVFELVEQCAVLLGGPLFTRSFYLIQAVLIRRVLSMTKRKFCNFIFFSTWCWVLNIFFILPQNIYYIKYILYKNNIYINYIYKYCFLQQKLNMLSLGIKSTYCSDAAKIEGYILFGLPVPFHVP